MLFPVLGRYRHPRLHGLAGRFRREHVSLVEHGSGHRLDEAANYLRKLGAAGADNAAEAENFAPLQSEGNVFDAVPGDIFQFENRLGGIVDRLAFGERFLEFAADHETDQFVPGRVRRPHGFDMLAVPDDGDAVGDGEHFLEPV